MSSIIGELKGIKDGMEVEWIINDFFKFAENSDVKYSSPSFDFGGETWCMWIYPNTLKPKDTVGQVKCFLIKYKSNSSIMVTYKLGLKKRDGNMDEKCSYTSTFKEEETGYGCKSIISKSELLERKSDLAPNNVVTIICKISREEFSIVSSKLDNFET